MASFTTIVRIKRLHRLAGLTVFIFILFLSITGIALNHSTVLGLADRQVPGWIAARYYDNTELSGFPFDDFHVFQLGSSLYVDDLAVADCTGELRGAVLLNQLVVLCGNDLLLLTRSAEIIERLGPVHGVPQSASGLGHLDGALVFETNGQWITFNPETLATGSLPEDSSVTWSVREPLPSAVHNDLLSGTVTWEKLVLDSHSGRIAGVSGTWLMDLVALALIFMSVTGLLLSRAAPRPDLDFED